MHTKRNSSDRMTYEDAVSAGQAIGACETLSAFLGPILRDTQRAGEKEGSAFLSGIIADLGALRESLRAMMLEDSIHQH